MISGSGISVGSSDDGALVEECVGSSEVGALVGECVGFSEDGALVGEGEKTSSVGAVVWLVPVVGFSVAGIPDDGLDGAVENLSSGGAGDSVGDAETYSSLVGEVVD